VQPLLAWQKPTQREQRLLLLCFAGIIIRLKIRTKLTVAPACAVHLRNEKQMAPPKARVGLAYANQQMLDYKSERNELFPDAKNRGTCPLPIKQMEPPKSE
jgi:hypothetical protein